MAAAPSRVAIIFGAGAKVGASVVKGFLGAGYGVATVSRTAKQSPPSDDGNNNNNNLYQIQADVSDPSVIPGIFSKLASDRKTWPFPSVVIWNAASNSGPSSGSSDPLDIFAVPDAAFDRDLDLLIKSPYIAAREALRVWRGQGEGEVGVEGGEDKKKGVERKGTFIMTGNYMPRKIYPSAALVTGGIGKSGANYWVGLGDFVFREKGIR